jgi:hypothetical protein
MAWNKQETQFLLDHYSNQGLNWCSTQLNKPSGSVRNKAWRLGLKQDKSSAFFKEWQSRAAKSKIGKKRPEQALVIKRLHDEGKLKMSDEGKKQISIKMKAWIETNGHQKGYLGLKHTDETKAIISQKSLVTWKFKTEQQKLNQVIKMLKTKIRNGTYAPARNASWKGGWRDIGGINKYYRSRWEANYARYLEWLKQKGEIADWKHEPTTFWFENIKRGVRSYLPDFLVTENNGKQVYHEVKGWMDPKSKTKLKRMAKYYPDVQVLLIDKSAYTALKKALVGLISDWE